MHHCSYPYKEKKSLFERKRSILLSLFIIYQNKTWIVVGPNKFWMVEKSNIIITQIKEFRFRGIFDGLQKEDQVISLTQS